jgi:LPS-assembly lipoprotein
MPRFPALLLLAGFAAALGGCGFEPLYARQSDFGSGRSSVAEDLAQVKIETIGNRSGQILRNYLVDGMSPRGEPTRPAYRLQVLLIEPRPQDLGIASDNSVVRFNFNARATYRLVDARSGRIIVTDSAVSSSSYEVTTSQYGTVASRDNARDRVLEELAQEICGQLADYFRQQRAAAPAPPATQ